jgi:hypothetical protein
VKPATPRMGLGNPNACGLVGAHDRAAGEHRVDAAGGHVGGVGEQGDLLDEQHERCGQAGQAGQGQGPDRAPTNRFDLSCWSEAVGRAGGVSAIEGGVDLVAEALDRGGLELLAVEEERRGALDAEVEAVLPVGAPPVSRVALAATALS